MVLKSGILARIACHAEQLRGICDGHPLSFNSLVGSARTFYSSSALWAIYRGQFESVEQEGERILRED